MNSGFLTRCILTSVFVLIVTQIVSASLGGPSIRRRRSPGLFKPPSLPSLDPSSIFNLTKIQEQINKLGNFSGGLEKALELEKKARLGLQAFVDSVKDRIESLENAALPDEENYWEESNSCGGVIVAQTGRIAYKVDTSYEHYEKCVWSIRTNYRSFVKIQLTSHGLESGYDYIAVTQISTEGEPKSYKLSHKGKYAFDGPLVLVSFITDGSGIGLGFSLDFEGIGRNINKDVAYKHFHFNDLSGILSVENVTSSEDSDSIVHFPSLSIPKTEFTTIVISPDVKNASQLSLSIHEEMLNLQPSTCEKVSLNFYDYLEENNTRSRCCGTSCEGVSSFRNEHGLILATLSKQLSLPQPESTFQFNWTARETTQRSDSIDTCGGTVSGRVGRISYKMETEYSSLERCVWAIKPSAKSMVKLIIHSQNFEDGYDFLTVSAVDENLEIVTTKLSQGKTSNFSGPVILVTFYSDDSTEGKGFELDWEEFGESAITTNDPVYFGQDSGTVALSLEAPSYQVVVINPKYLDGSSIKLKLNSFESQPEKEKVEHDCKSGGLYVYGNDEYNFTLAQKYCDLGEEIPPEEFSALGGVFILLVKINTPETVTKLELSWQKGSPALKPNFEGLKYVNITDECGGVLVGDAGHIQYKLNSPYEDNARCTYVVQSNQLSKMSFKLIKDGFESCCDYLIATPLNVDTGTLGESLIINRETRIQTFSTPVVFITFYSDPSLGYSGFRLEFTTSGTPIEKDGKNPVGFSHHIWRETPGNVSLVQPVEDNQLDGTATPKIITHVLNSNMDGSVMNPLTIEAQTNDFQVDGTCQLRDSLTFFQVRNPVVGEAISESVGCSDDDDPNSCACTPHTSKTFKMEANFFIAIFKPLFESNKASFNFSWALVEQPVEN